jgi:hypothetical protein
MLDFRPVRSSLRMDPRFGDETIARTQASLKNATTVSLPQPNDWSDSLSVTEPLPADVYYGQARSPVWVRSDDARLAWARNTTTSDNSPLAMEVTRWGRTVWRQEGLDPNQGTVSIPVRDIPESGPWFQCRLYRVDTGRTVAQIDAIDIKMDADNDGLDDDWELRHFGDLQQGPDDDPDGDGASNLCEYHGMTDPKVPTIYASDRKELYGKIGFGLVERNVGQVWGGGKILVDGVEWDKSLGVHADSVVEYEVPAGVNAFRAMCATWDRNGATVRFECYVNGDLAYRGREYTEYSYPEFVEVPVKPGDRLKLVVDSLANIDRDHSCWLQPAFINTDTDPLVNP